MPEQLAHDGLAIVPADGGVATAPTDTPSPAATHPRSGFNWHRIAQLAGLLLALAAAIMLYHLLSATSYADVKLAVSRLGWESILLAAVATCVSYLAVTGYDFLALRHVGVTGVPIAAIGLTSFISQAFTYTLGFGMLSGGAVRWRLYHSFGLKPTQILAVSTLAALAFWLGLAAVSAITLLLRPQAISGLDGLPATVNFGIGSLVAFALAAWLIATALKPRAISGDNWSIPLPAAGTTAMAVLIGAADTLAAAAALWMLLPPDTAITFGAFLAVFTIATVLGVVSHVPGGLGVFEATMLLAFPQAPQAGMIGALLLFRLVYYAIPFIIATLMLVAYELRHRTAFVGRAARGFGEVMRPIVPRALAAAVFAGGMILLLSGATPAEHYRMHLLRDVIPLPFVETSHFFASVTGLVLLLVAYGLLRRMANAWRLAILLLLAGAAFSLLKGLDIEEAAVCTGVAVLLAASRDEFYRQADLFSVRPSVEWMIAAAVAVGASIWLGFFVSRNVEYQNNLWWDFGYRADAAHFMRATLGVAVAAIGIAAYIMLHRARRAFAPASAQEIDAVAPLVAASRRCDANLALLGDKQFMLAPDNQGFVMYGVQGSNWIAMGDPVAPDERIEDMIWQFRELADRHAGMAAFYQVDTEHLPAYLDAGLSLVKLGEEAWVDLTTFTLEGGEGRRLRQALAKAQKGNLSFEIVPAADVPAILPELEAVSDAWLASRGSREKGFSLGFWSPSYLTRYDQAVIRHDGRIVAFANIWRSSGQAEMTVDLMRHLPDAPPGTMDMIFISLLARAREEGFSWFNLGMAPLSGLATHRLASIWSRVGSFIYRRADRFYNFEGLRAYKDKFKPQWRPRYLAFPAGFGLPGILMDVTTLIAASPRRALPDEDD